MPSRRDISRTSVHDGTLSQLLYSPLYKSLAPDLQDLVRISVGLYTREKRLGVQFPDYSFVVFPMAKAYEGFLKQYLFQMRLLSPDMYQDRRFRIGRALNPDLRNHQRDEQWLYDDIVRMCSESVGRQLWDTWLQCRNRIFHYFPGALQRISLEKAGEYLVMLIDAMNEARSCQNDAGSQHRNSDRHGSNQF